MKKITIQNVQYHSAEWSVKLLSTEYKSCSSPLLWKCCCGNIFSRSYERMKYKKHKLCDICSLKQHKQNIRKSNSYSHEQVENIIQSQGCRLLSPYLGDYTGALLIKCSCGNTFSRSLQTFRNSKAYHCEKCSGKTKWNIDSVRDYVEHTGGILLSSEYTNASAKLKFRCPTCDKTFERRFADFKQSASPTCPSCSGKQGWSQNPKKVTIDAVRAFVSNTNVRLISTNIDSITQPLTFECACSKQYIQPFSIFRTRTHHECPTCAYKRRVGFDENQIQNLNNKQKLIELHHTKLMNMAEIATKLGVSVQCVCDYFHRHGIQILNFPNSKGENDIAHFIRNILPPECSIETNSKNIIPPYELDLYLPDNQVAIEYCGIYWHSEAANRGSTYHKSKHDKCKNLGIRLLTIYEDEWLKRSTIVKNMIRSILGLNNNHVVYARNTSIAVPTFNERKQFCERFHIQGNGRGSVWYALYHQDAPVAMIGLVNNAGHFLLNRFCSNGRVIGGFTKLLKHFQKNHQWKTIYTFADKRWSVGDLYTKSGFTVDAEIKPDFYYVRNGKRYHKFAFRHVHLPKKILQYDPKLSEWQNCKKNGMTRIWDCGKIRFSLAS